MSPADRMEPSVARDHRRLPLYRLPLVAPRTPLDRALFRFSDKFREEILPHTIELGRSFVQPRYQSRDNNKSIFALDNLWDGLGALTVLNPEIRYFFGKVTMYTDFNVEARNILIYFMHRYFPDHDHLMEGIDPVEMDIDYAKFDAMFTGDNYNEDHRTLCQQVRARGENIPPLINSYMSLSPTMRRPLGSVCRLTVIIPIRLLSGCGHFRLGGRRVRFW